MWRATFPVAFLAALALSACGGNAGSPTSTTSENAQMAMPTTAAASGAAAESAAMDATGNRLVLPQEPQAAPVAQAQQNERMVIKTAQLQLEVASVDQAESTVRAKVEAMGGYIVQSQSVGSDEDRTITLTFRVPAARFEEALSGVEGMANKVLGRTLGGEDVTEEYVDLESRVRNLEATRARLLDLLQKSNQVEDALSVNQALTDVQGQVEQARGRMEYLKKSSAMATISVNLLPVPPEPAVVPEEGWQPVRVAREALGGVVRFGQGLAELIIVLLVWTPVWLPFVLVGWWLRRRMLRGRKPAPVAQS